MKLLKKIKLNYNLKLLDNLISNNKYDEYQMGESARW